MSFAFMPTYTGDYLRDTRHLTPMKHGIYLLLLMHCWDQKGPVPLDEQEAAGIANCRSADEIDGLRYVLRRFFTRMDDGWYNKRMTEEVAKAEHLSRELSQAGKKSGAIRAARSAARAAAKIPSEPRFNLGSAYLEPGSVPPPPHSVNTKSKEKAKPKARSAPGISVDLPVWLNESDWQAFLAHRAGIRKPMSAEAQRRAVIRLGKFRREGHDPNKVLDLSIVNGWQGLFVDSETKAGQDLEALIAELTAKEKQSEGE